MIKKGKDESGSLTIFSILIILGVLIMAGLFINITITYLNVNFSKKALEESVRIRALAVDVPVKETVGVVEVIHAPYKPSKIGYQRPTSLYGEIAVPGVDSAAYLDKVKVAETNAKYSFIQSVNSTFLTNLRGEKTIEIDLYNICYDVEPLPKNEEEVTFKCALKGQDEKIYTVTATIPVMGYVEGVNQVIDETQIVDDDATDDEKKKVQVSNVVFGAAMISPKSFIKQGLESLGLNDEPPTIIYSVAYPQVDACYGSYCEAP